MQSQLRWAGHVARMPDHRLPKRFFYGELQQGKRSHRGQKKRFRDTLKVSLKAFDINPDSWEESAVDRDKWRAAVHKGAKLCEANRTAAAVQKRQARNSRANKLPDNGMPVFVCPNCQRTFRAQIGLFSHLRIHR
ncbi:uncharacterized protein LOC143286577 [Babylonia areolata]|uniref:uncharacterized protein LOC143286577 n=1 Tax=Babylonia areolata TaxID=304850 RepID=UPI003FD5790D